MLDQFMINKNTTTGDAPIKADPNNAQILNLPAMVIQVSSPSRSHSAEWASRSQENGFSDPARTRCIKR
jgi:hypothetical protein